MIRRIILFAALACVALASGQDTAKAKYPQQLLFLASAIASYPFFDMFFTANGTVVVPQGLNFLYVDACSGGGAGNDGSGGATTGTGAGSGAACLVNYPLLVTPGQTLTITVGAAGTHNLNNAGVTSISGTSINFPTIPAGVNASNGSNNVATAGTATVLTAFASPYLIGGTNASAGSGGGGGPTLAGGSGLFPGGNNNATNNGNAANSGAGGSSAFGPGGNGVTVANNGTTPAGYGGGGSGCAFYGPGSCTAGNGAPGFVHLHAP